MAIGYWLLAINCSFLLHHRVGADSQQSALLAGDGAVRIATHIIEVDDSIARCGVDGEAVVECGIIGIEFTIHGVAVATQVVNAAHHRCSISTLTTHAVPSEQVTRIVGAVRHDDFVLVGTIRSDISRVALQARAPREAGEAVIGSCTHDILCAKHFGIGITFVEVAPLGGRKIGRRHHLVHEPCHHHAVSLHTHAAGTHIGIEQP